MRTRAPLGDLPEPEFTPDFAGEPSFSEFLCQPDSVGPRWPWRRVRPEASKIETSAYIETLGPAIFLAEIHAVNTDRRILVLVID